MLTKSDLDQIRKVVKDEIKPVKMGVKSLDQKIDKVQIDLGGKIGKLDKNLDNVQEDIAEILVAIDKRETAIEARVDRLEEEVGISNN